MRKVQFETDRKNEKTGIKKLAVILVAGTLLILTLSIVAILYKNDFDFSRVLSGEPAATEAETDDENEEIPDFRRNYILWCLDDENKTLTFVMQVGVSAKSGKISIKSISPNVSVTSGENTLTLNSFYNEFGAGGLKEALQIYCGHGFDAYLGSDKTSFRTMIDFMGSIKVNVGEQIDYRSEDFNLILIKGENTMKGDTLYKYFKYLSNLGPQGLEIQAKTMKEVIEAYLTEKNYSRFSSVSSKMLNTLVTDMTALNFTENEEMIKYFIHQ